MYACASYPYVHLSALSVEAVVASAKHIEAAWSLTVQEQVAGGLCRPLSAVSHAAQLLCLFDT